ncbi:MAG TPA: amidohydrolase family protein [Bryobacteraceae bacterium]|nr:amidohydrolase family protein [Bryobacteraceae bacterium]
MLNRRVFLRDAASAAGVVFTGCCVSRCARAFGQTGRTSRGPVMLGGRRVKVIDFHAHCVIPEAMELMGRKTPAQDPLLIGPARFHPMDEQRIDIEVLSINPFWYSAERDLARRIVQIQNEKLAELCATHSDRLLAFATVAIQYPDLAVEQLEEAVNKLGLRGVSLGGSVNGEELSAPKFDPFWAKAEELGIPVFIHPQGVPELQKRLQGNGFLSNVIGNPLETTIALSHLIFDGTLDHFPALKICAAHGGGYLPSYAARSDRGCLTFPNSCNKTLKKHPSEYLKQLYFDSLVFTPEGLRHLAAEVGASQIVLGTDYPFPWISTAVEHVLATPGLTDSDREAILSGNAAKLLRIS